MSAHVATPPARFRLPRPAVAAAALAVALVVAPGGPVPAADHRDGPFFINTAANGQQDLNDLFVFQSPAPANAGNTVIILTAQPFPGNLTPTTFDPMVVFDVKVDTNGDNVEDLTFRITTGAPDANGVQDVLVRGLPSTRFPPLGIVARGKTGQNISILGGTGMFRAAIQDDPFFFDGGGLTTLFSGTAPMGFTFPRPAPANPANPQPGDARNFFGPRANTMACVLELPSARLAPNGTVVGVWTTSTRNGYQVDRTARPAINTALIPPLPRNNLTRGDRRSAFNIGAPANDVRDFKADMSSVLKSFYGRTDADTNALAGLLLPDVLKYEVGNSKGFGTFIAGGTALGNGRRLRDDVIDFELAVLTNGGITTDNVGDDNGDRITDGTVGPNGPRPALFPYIGPPNTPGTGPNP